MSTAQSRSGTRRQPVVAEQSGRGEGWVVFAGTMLLIAGVMNTIGGIGAISNSKFFVGDAKYVFGDLKTWGWIILIMGAGQILTAIGIGAGNQLARWAGVGFAALNGLAQLLMFPAYPFWSLSLFAIDILVTYALIVYGDLRVRG